MSQLTLDSQLLRMPGMVSSEMDGDLVMMSIEHGKYFGISGVGQRVWELIENPISLRDLVATLLQEFEIDEATCRSDVLGFASSLLEHKVAKLC